MYGFDSLSDDGLIRVSREYEHGLAEYHEGKINYPCGANVNTVTGWLTDINAEMAKRGMRVRIPQSRHTKLCGQIAVAVIARIPLEEAIEAVGHSKSTKTRELVRVLRSLGFECPDRARRLGSTTPLLVPLGLGIMRPWYRKGGSWHWVVLDHGRIIDGQNFVSPDGWRVTSYVPVIEP